MPSPAPPSSQQDGKPHQGRGWVGRSGIEYGREAAVTAPILFIPFLPLKGLGPGVHHDRPDVLPAPFYEVRFPWLIPRVLLLPPDPAGWEAGRDRIREGSIARNTPFHRDSADPNSGSRETTGGGLPLVREADGGEGLCTIPAPAAGWLRPGRTLPMGIRRRPPAHLDAVGADGGPGHPAWPPDRSTRPQGFPAPSHRARAAVPPHGTLGHLRPTTKGCPLRSRR